MAYSIPELKRILFYHLVQDPGVFALVEGRVFTSPFGKDVEEASKISPLVVVDFRGGPQFSAAPVARRSFHLYAYSNRSDGEADALYVAAAEVLRHRGLCAPPDQNGDPCFPSRGYFSEQDSAITGWNPETQSWFSRGAWVGWQFG